MRIHQRGDPDRVPSILVVITALVLGAVIYIAAASGFADFLKNVLLILIT